MKWIKRMIVYGILGMILFSTIGIGGAYVDTLEYEVKMTKPEVISYDYQKVDLEEIPDNQIAFLVKYAAEPEEELYNLRQDKDYVKMTYCLSNSSNYAIALSEGSLFHYESMEGYVRALRAEAGETIFDKYDTRRILPAGKSVTFTEYIEVPKGSKTVEFYLLQDSDRNELELYSINL